MYYQDARQKAIEYGWLTSESGANSATSLIKSLKGCKLPGLIILDVDMESVDSHGFYANLLTEVSEFTVPELGITRLKNAMDEVGHVSMTFKYGGEQITWSFKQAGDWVSEEFTALLLAFYRKTVSDHCLWIDDDMDPYGWLVFESGKDNQGTH